MTLEISPSPEANAAEAADSSRSAREFSLAEKLRIVHEANAPGVKFCHVERKYGLGKNVLAYWRRTYSGLTESALVAAMGRASSSGAGPELVALRLQVERLERLLGQKTFELELLRGEAR